MTEKFSFNLKFMALLVFLLCYSAGNTPQTVEKKSSKKASKKSREVVKKMKKTGYKYKNFQR